MNYVGLAITTHDESLAFVENNKLKYHLQSERYSRIKRHKIHSKNKYISPYKINNIKEINKKYHNILSSKNYEYLCTSSNIIFLRNSLEIKDFELYNFIKKNSLINNDEINLINNFIPTNLEDYLIINDKIYYIDHHQAHAAYSLYTSPFESSDVLAYDGMGKLYQSVFINENKEIINYGAFAKHNHFSVGLIWMLMGLKYEAEYLKMLNSIEKRTQILDEMVNSPGKIMALSSYGKPNDFYISIFYKFLEELNEKNFKTIKTPIYSHLKEVHKDYFIFLDNHFGKNTEKSNRENYYKDIFASLQQFSIDIVIEGLTKLKKSDNLCITGGCALNGYINEEIIKRKLYKNVHLSPASSDEGQSIGCALHALNNFEGKRIQVNNPKDIIYLGEKYEIKEKYHNLYLEDEELFSFIAKKISEGFVIGWYQDRCESGPRALGNRSILADPRNPKMRDHINFKIKKREWYRPFAPSILKEHVKKWFITNGVDESPYMLRIMKYKKNKSKLVPAVTHIDDTARIQTVTEEINPKFYKLIKEFYNLTKIPILLNTSFNGKTEPMVETPEDAKKTFLKNNIDILVLGNYIFFRNGNENVKPLIEES